MSTPSADRLLAAYAALAVAVNVLESGFPSPLPGIKPGLANVVTLIVLLRHGWRAAAWVSLLRVVAGSLLTGSLFAPGFWLAGSGALAALGALAVGSLWNGACPGVPLSAVGLSVLAAQAHLLGQFGIGFLLFIPHAGLVHLLPPMLALSSAFGMVTGLAAQQVLRALQRSEGVACQR